MAMNDPEKAEKTYRQAIRFSPRNSDPYVRAGVALLRLKRVHDAENEFDYAVQIGPKNARAYGLLGNIQVATGRKDQGLANLKRAVFLSPEDASLHNMLATGYASAGMTAEAAAQFRAAIAVDPEFAIGYYNLACSLKQLNKPMAALTAYEAYLRKCADHPGPAMVGVPTALKEVEHLKRTLFAGAERR